MRGMGRGVIATKEFKEGEVLCEYTGTLLSYEEGIELENEYAKMGNIGCYVYFFKYRSKRLVCRFQHIL